MNGFHFGFFDELRKLAADRGVILKPRKRGSDMAIFWERTPDGKIKYEKPVPAVASHPRIKQENDAIREMRYGALAKRSPVDRKKAMLFGGLAGAALGYPVSRVLHTASKGNRALGLLGLGALTYAGARFGQTIHDYDKARIEEAKRELKPLNKTAAEREPIDWDAHHGKAFRWAVTPDDAHLFDLKGNRIKRSEPTYSLVTPENNAAWTDWKPAPDEFVATMKKKWRDTSKELPSYKYNQIMRARKAGDR